MKANVAVIIPAAGESTRLGLNRRKPFVELAGRPIILHTLSRFTQLEGLSRMVVALNPKDLAWAVDSFGARFEDLGATDIIAGGSTRTETVKKCLELVRPDCTIVVIHDGARPLVSRQVIMACIRRAGECGGAVAAVRMQPTVKEVYDGVIAATLDRGTLWGAQTPQAFRHEIIRRAYEGLATEGRELVFTDDATIVERLGERVEVVQDRTSNIKITTREDLIVAEALLAHEMK